MIDARQQLLEENPHLHPGEMLAQTDVGPITEGKLGVRLPVHLEGERLRKNFLIAICGRIAHHQAVPGLDIHAAQRVIHLGGPEEMLYGRPPSQELVDGLIQRRGSGSELRHFGRPLRQRL